MKEFKFVEFKKNKYSYEEIEAALAVRAADGWEVVNMSVDISTDLRGIVVVLLQRDRA